MTENDKQKVTEAIRILIALITTTATPFNVRATGSMGEGDKKVRGFLKVVRKGPERSTD